MPVVLLLPLALLAACDKVPLLAPTGSVITLLPEVNNVPLNSSVTIVATVIENGVASSGTGPGGGTTSRAGNGTPVQNGTLVTFTTTIGRIEPSDARTHNGQVSVQLITDSTSGLATITAYSGGASAQITNLKIGTAAVKTVTITSVPQSLGSSGGQVSVVANVTDEGGAPVAGIPVTFATDHGTMSPPTVPTDTSGNATSTLTTTVSASVTATAGTVTSTAAKVTVNAFGLSGFTITSTSSTAAGVPVTFQVTPTTGVNLTNVKVDFGDGQSRNLGPISAAQSIQHAYCSAGSFNAVATVTDASGGTGSLSQTVLVGSLPVTLSSSGTTSPGSPITFTVAFGTAAPVVDHFLWTFDDGTGQFTTTSTQLPHTFTTRGLKNVRVDVAAIGGCFVGSAAVTLDIE
jgi:adhesin/invasin